MNLTGGSQKHPNPASGDAGSTTRCFSCGALVPDRDGPTHRYMLASPGCWHVFGEVLAREYENRAYWPKHRLTVDCYAVQHPGEPNPQAIQSVAVHLISLCMVLERNVPPDSSTKLLNKVLGANVEYQWLKPPESLGELTVVDVHAASTAEAHLEAIQAWAESSWQAWSDHHETVRKWLPID